MRQSHDEIRDGGLHRGHDDVRGEGLPSWEGHEGAPKPLVLHFLRDAVTCGHHPKLFHQGLSLANGAATPLNKGKEVLKGGPSAARVARGF